MLLDVLKHPVAAHVVLVAACNAVQATVVRDDSATELGNVVFEVNQVLALLVRDHVVEMDVFVPPFEVVDYPFVRQFLFDDEQILEKVNDPLVDIEVVELRNHRFLVF